MFRIAGAGFLLLGMGGYSFCLCREMRERLKCLYEMKRMYEQFHSQIGYSMAAFPEMCKMTQASVKEPYTELLRDIYMEAESNTGKAFPKIWEEQVEMHFVKFPLKKEDKILLKEFSRSFGYADRDLQEQAIKNQLTALCAVIHSLEIHMSEKEKMIMSLGTLGALLILILLI